MEGVVYHSAHAEVTSAYTNMSTPSPITAPTRRALWDTHLLHGSVRGVLSPDTERHGTDETGTALTKTASGSVATGNGTGSASYADGTGEALPWESAHPQTWTIATVAAFLERMSVPESGLKYALQHSMDGAMLLDCVEDVEAHQMMQELMGIENRMTRVAIIGAVKRASRTHSAAVQSEGVTDKQGVKMLTGEKNLTMPSFPEGEPGQPLGSAADWKLFITSASTWSNLESEDYGYLISKLGEDPETDLSAVYSTLTKTELRMDTVLGTQLWLKAATGLQKLFVTKETRTINGKTSALQMIAFLGKRINRKCDSRYLQLYQELTVRDPLSSPTMITEELNSITALRDDLMAQGQAITSLTLYSVLQKAVSGLLKKAELNVALLECKKKYGMDGEKLLETLREAEYELTHNSEYKDLMATKPTVVPVAAGAEQGGRRRLRGVKGRPGEPCLNERDFGNCKLKDSGCPCVHDVAEFTQKLCTHEVYQDLGVCPNFYPKAGKELCMDKHQKKSGAEVREALKAAKEKYPDHFAGVEPITTATCDLDQSNIISGGSRRVTRAPERLVNDMIGLQIENQEEEAAITGILTGSDPEVTDTSTSQDEGKGEGDSFVSSDESSGQSGEWQPTHKDSSSDTEEYEVPSQLAHLAEEGLSLEEIAQLEGELEVIADRIMAMNAVGLSGDAARVLLDGGTFAHSSH